jgi:hypothetical protein
MAESPSHVSEEWRFWYAEASAGEQRAAHLLTQEEGEGT